MNTSTAVAALTPLPPPRVYPAPVEPGEGGATGRLCPSHGMTARVLLLLVGSLGSGGLRVRLLLSAAQRPERESRPETGECDRDDRHGRRAGSRAGMRSENENQTGVREGRLGC